MLLNCLSLDSLNWKKAMQILSLDYVFLNSTQSCFMCRPWHPVNSFGNNNYLMSLFNISWTWVALQLASELSLG